MSKMANVESERSHSTDETTGTHDGTHSSSTFNEPNTAAVTTGHTGTGHHNTGVSTGLGTSGTHGERNPELTNTGLGSNTHHGTTGLGSSTSGYDNTTGSTGLGSSTSGYDNTTGSTGLGSSTTHGTTGLGSSTTHGSTGLGSSTSGYDNTTGSTGLGSSTTHGTTGLGSSTTHGSTGLGSSTTGYGSDPTGPHGSHALNKADPRVDSDRFGTAGNTAGAGGIGGGQYTEGTHSHGTTGGLGGHSGGHGTADFDDRAGGTHNTRLGNVLHPHGNTTGSTGAGLGSSGLGHSSYNDPTGPHSSHLANEADPRVDSDRYGSAGNTAGAGGVGAGQYSGQTHGSSGIGGTSSGYGDNTTGYTGGATGEHIKTVPGEVEGTGRDNLSHRNNEDGSLPKALTEDVSKAQPHSSLTDDQHHAGTHGTTHDAHGKPSMMDKLNPKVDADGDGKAGFMK
jgi:hypothetical protein